MMVRNGDVDLHVVIDGPDGGDPVVLIAGADNQYVRWPAVLVDALVEQGHRVIRFDNRDSGASTHRSVDEPYRLVDMADDTLAVMDACGVDAAHVVGRSMGGMIAQVVTLEAPERVRTLALLCTTPGAGDERLPGPDDALVEKMAERLFAPPPTTTTEERVRWVADLDALFAGTRYRFARAEAEAVAAQEIARDWYPESGQGAAVYSSPSRIDRLGEIEAPTLVVHGTADPVFAVEHATTLADGIAGARLELIEGLGHELPVAFFEETLIALLLGHVAGS